MKLGLNDWYASWNALSIHLRMETDMNKPTSLLKLGLQNGREWVDKKVTDPTALGQGL